MAVYLRARSGVAIGALLVSAVGCTSVQDCTVVAGSSQAFLVPEEGVVVTEFCVEDECYRGRGDSPSVPIEDEPGELTYSFVAMIDGVEARGDGTIESEAWYPNGRACPPSLARADLQLGIDGEVRPAEG